MAETVVPTRRSTSRSAELFDRSLEVLVDGVSSPSRGRTNYRPYPLFIDRGRASHVIDVDDNEYLDLMLAYGALIHGHAHPRLVKALQEAVARGSLFAAASEIEVEVAEKLCAMIPCAERVRFANTGTEAAMAALRIVRGYTGKKKIIKFEGHYHGWSDAFSISSNPLPVSALGDARDPVRVPDSSGLTGGALEDTVVVAWNDADLVEAALRRHPGEVAAIVTEPVMANIGVIPPDPGYLQTLRELADRYDALLYIDETVAGFRFAPGGAQERFGVRADIATFGKALGAGFPVAAIAGRADIMDVLAEGRVLHYGTQNAHSALLSVVAESLKMLTENDAQAFVRLERLADRLIAGVSEALTDAAAAAIVQHVGPMLQIYFLLPGHEDTPSIRDVRDFSTHVDRARFNRFAHTLFDEGVYLSPAAGLHSVLSTVHTEEDVQFAIEAMRRALAIESQGNTA